MDLEVASADDMFIKCGAKAVGMSAVTWVAYVTGMHLTGTVRGCISLATSSLSGCSGVLGAQGLLVGPVMVIAGLGACGFWELSGCSVGPVLVILWVPLWIPADPGESQVLDAASVRGPGLRYVSHAPPAVVRHQGPGGPGRCQHASPGWLCGTWP